MHVSAAEDHKIDRLCAETGRTWDMKKRSETMIQLDSIRGMIPSLAETLKEVGDSL